MMHHRRLLLRSVLVLTIKIKIRADRKLGRGPDCTSGPALSCPGFQMLTVA